MNKLGKKILATVLGLLVILVILEIALRVLGFSYEQKTSAEESSQVDQSSDYTILTIGDSFTRGMGAPVGEDFSTQLEIMLNENANKRFNVVNGGLSGANSSQILKTLESRLDKIHPDLLILLFGGANTWNHWGLDTYKESGSSATSWLYNIRLYKLTVLLINNIRNKQATEELTESGNIVEPERFRKRLEELESRLNTDPNNGNIYYEMGCLYLNERDIQKGIEAYEKGIEVDPDVDNNYIGVAAGLQMTGRIDEAIEWIHKGMKRNPDNLNYYNQLIMFYNYSGNYAKQIDWAMKGIARNPQIGNFYRYLVMLPDEEKSRFKDTIDAFLEKYPQSSNKRFINLEHPCFYDRGDVDVKTTFGDRQEEILAWVRHDHERVIEMCKRRGIDLIIQSYPLRREENFWSGTVRFVNKDINKTAKEYNIPFVDQYTIFNTLGNKLDEYLEPPGGSEHCNAKGYRLMAKNLYSEIVSGNYFDPSVWK